MIRHVTSTLSTFKTLTFRPGLNLLLADKSPGATDRHTRNSAGKSSFVEIVHFLLGGDCKSKSIFRSDRLRGEQFSMRFDLAGTPTFVSRTGESPSRIIVDSDDRDWPTAPKLDKATGEQYISNKEWIDILGLRMFGSHRSDTAYGPSFRSMLSYFARREGSGGFHAADQQSVKQSHGDVQVNVSFLLGLDWQASQSLQLVRVKEKALKTLKKEAKSGVLGQLVGKAGELRTRLTVAEKAAKKLAGELSALQVLPEYKDLEREASGIAIRIASLTNENTLDRERMEMLENQLADERAPNLPDIEKMYREAQVILPDLVVKQLADVQKFHDAVIRNRRSHLQGEVEAAAQRIASRGDVMGTLDNRRREIVEILDSHGAIDQMTRLQGELSRQQAHVEDLRKRLELARQVEATQTDLTIERAQIHRRLTNDIAESGEILSEAIVAFEEFSQRISDHEGSLTIEVTDNGPEFSIQVEGGRSKGIKNMQIFCFDMMLAVLWSGRHAGPGFLIHDSHLFDGMDSRQIGKAIEIGAEQSAKHGFQYIITLNSDVLDSAEFSDKFDPQGFVNPVRLSDALETGGLFGVRI